MPNQKLFKEAIYQPKFSPEKYFSTLANPVSIILPHTAQTLHNTTDILAASGLRHELAHVPPNTAQINFTNLGSFSASPQGSKVLNLPDLKESNETIPDDFSWSHLHIKNPKVKKLYPILTKVQNQYQCGCCWAMAFSTSLSDNFIIQGVVDYNPEISTTYAMTQVIEGAKSAQTYNLLTTTGDACSGGNSAELAEFIINYPVADQRCIDYSWCQKNITCTASQSNDAEDLNNLLPNYGCYTSGGDDGHLGYLIDKAWHVSIDDYANAKSGDPQAAFELAMKRRILDNGPLIAGFLVFSNFTSGKFTSTTDLHGIYFEQAIYDGTGTNNVQWNQTIGPPQDYMGAHAVSVVGWGVEKNITYCNASTGQLETGDVDYWLVRNTWGESWGSMAGYFKIAKYPINQYSQFDKLIDMPGTDEALGGFITMDVSKKGIEKLVPTPSDGSLRTSSNENNSVPTVGLPTQSRLIRKQSFYRLDNDQIAKLNSLKKHHKEEKPKKLKHHHHSTHVQPHDRSKHKPGKSPYKPDDADEPKKVNHSDSTHDESDDISKDKSGKSPYKPDGDILPSSEPTSTPVNNNDSNKNSSELESLSRTNFIIVIGIALFLCVIGCCFLLYLYSK